MVKIEFNTAELTAKEALAVANFLGALFPLELPAVNPPVHNVTLNIDANEAVREIAEAMDAPAPDGYPMQADDVDAEGIRWDERIHAGTKAKNKDGTWTRRRNTPDDVFNSVMAELRGATSTLAPPAPAVAEPTAAEAFTPPAFLTASQTVVATPVTTPQPPAPPAPVIPAPPAASGAAPSAIDIMRKVTSLQAEKKLTLETLNAMLSSAGIEGMAKLFTSSDDQRSAFASLLDTVQ